MMQSRRKLDEYFAERKVLFQTAQALGMFPQDGEEHFLKKCIQERKFLEGKLAVARPLRLQQELEFWLKHMEKDLEEEDDPLVRGWVEECIPPMKKALNLLVRGMDGEAFAIVAAMAEDMGRYGPLPDPLQFDHIMWCDG